MYFKFIIIKIEIVKFNNKLYFFESSFNENNDIKNIENSLFY